MATQTRLDQQLNFIKEIDKLKYIQRKTRLFNSDRHENDAEHSWHLAMMSLVLAEHSNQDIDILKVLKMVLIHDLVEIDAGDTFLFDTQKNHTNTTDETIAAKRIFGLLPPDQTQAYISLWQEFENAITPEAKFAKAIDRLEPVLQNVSNKGGTWKEFNVPYKTIYNKLKNNMINGSKILWNFTEKKLNHLFTNNIINS
ncbi:HD domain-containing protein [Aquimarina rhabdastrellae]